MFSQPAVAKASATTPKRSAGNTNSGSDRRRSKTLLAADDTPPALKDRLALVLQIRRFAETELKLPANGHYLRYADLQRRFVVWNVYAAPEFSMTPKSWWYPVVGSLDYRGYFSEEKARAHAAELQAGGFDTYIGGVTAYSTLGWFCDPVLNTFIDEPEADLADLLFHELAHQRLFIPGDTEFNEAFATAVAEEGTRRWMESRTNQIALAEYHRQSRRTAEFVELVATARGQLDALYTNAVGTFSSNDSHHQERARQLRLEKQRIANELRQGYADVKQRWGGQRDYDLWFSQPLNNAQLNTVDTYYKLVPAFRGVLRSVNGDLEKFFVVVESLRKLKKEERRVHLARLAANADQAASE
ncbi:MAG: aminopeptidase [Verrucomicrobia bacterium]|nr:aminopeptidase [Verrucomicrobiota bacterium]